NSSTGPHLSFKERRAFTASIKTPQLPEIIIRELANFSRKKSADHQKYFLVSADGWHGGGDHPVGSRPIHEGARMPSSAWSFWLKGRKLADEGIRAPFPAFMNRPLQPEGPPEKF